MTGMADPEFPALPVEAHELLTAIRDHLDVPLYPEGDKKARRAWQSKVEARVADVVAVLNNLLPVPLADVAEHAAQLREFAAEEDALYREMEAGQ
jgi:hypothetical protein